MKIRKLLCISCLFYTLNVFADSAVTLPGDVQQFIDSADACEHFAGEWDNTLPEVRQREIEQSVDKNCGTARRQQSELKKKYKGNNDMEKIINNYDL